MDTLRLYWGGAAATDSARAVFFARWREAASAEDEALLRRLLQAVADDEAKENIAADGALLLPLAGTVSPWSSKATDIAHRCNLARLARVERGWWHADIAAAQQACDRMRQQVLAAADFNQWQRLFAEAAAAEESTAAETTAAAMTADDIAAHIAQQNESQRLGLAAGEVAHLAACYAEAPGGKRMPTRAELMMFAQANSEHCRHKLFNARWQCAGEDAAEAPPHSLMDFIRRTHNANPHGVITAFNDNAAVVEAAAGNDFAPGADDIYAEKDGGLYLVAKAETHNHPTAISPFPGAATGSGGEIRDEAAAGCGAAARAGFSGYIVSSLSGDGSGAAVPPTIATPQEIIAIAPLGAAAYNNEFGRPALAGFFRSYEETRGGRCFGFHKPLMLAGGLGHMLPQSAGKRALPVGALIVQLGGPGFRIGIGGGSASSRGGGRGGAEAALDFASVQRDNAEMQRRAQQVLDALRRRTDNIILSLHDVGAGGLANAVCELVHDGGRGARVRLDAAPVGEANMTAAEIWCNESQERYVLVVAADAAETLAAVCARERCPHAVIGEVTEAQNIVATRGGTAAVALPLAAVLEVGTQLDIAVQPLAIEGGNDSGGGSTETPLLAVEDFSAAALAVLRHPTVACKRFLITIGDRTVGGLTAREQMVGAWQTPVADCAVLCNDFTGVGGAAFALGERAPVAAINPAAAARLAIAEAVLNLSAAVVDARAIKLSLNWLANCAGEKDEADMQRRSELYAAVRAASDFCVALEVGIIVGKDSLSMRMESGAASVEAPACAAAFAFAPMADVRRALTPQLSGRADTVIMRLGLEGSGDEIGSKHPALAGSVAEQAGVFRGKLNRCADVNAEALAAALKILAQCRSESLLLAYHDCSDGGSWAALCEMAFAANIGLDIFADTIGEAAPHTDGGGGDGWQQKAAAALLSESPAVLLEVEKQHAARVMDIVSQVGGGQCSVQTIAAAQPQGKNITVHGGGRALLQQPLAALRRVWEEAGASIAIARGDNPACVAAESGRDLDADGGLFARLPANLPAPLPCPAPAHRRSAPRVAILREVGSNGQREMAAAFTSAGFQAVDITMQDLQDGRHDLGSGDIVGAALCGGFSYGDVLGAGRGWAQSILNNARLADMLAAFFARADTFTLGVCNGCQALAQLQALMPDADAWRFPDFLANESRRFEARLCMAEVVESPSVLLRGMAGMMLPIVVSHGEGKVDSVDSDSGQISVDSDSKQMAAAPLALRYVDNDGAATDAYPYNPNGSAGGATGFCSPDGRITLMMPHPERLYRRVQLPDDCYRSAAAAAADSDSSSSPYTAWKVLFDNAMRAVRG